MKVLVQKNGDYISITVNLESKPSQCPVTCSQFNLEALFSGGEFGIVDILKNKLLIISFHHKLRREK